MKDFNFALRNLIKMPKYIFNDPNKTNDRGFRILNEGIDLTRFATNPVMLNQHLQNTDAVIGKWVNIGIIDGKLCAEPQFNSEDALAKSIQSKVEGGFINSVSMGVVFNFEDLQMIENELVLTKCQLYECSFVAIPSNANSVKLYSQELLDIDEKAFNQHILQLKSDLTTQHIKTQNIQNMKITFLALSALALTETFTDVELSNAIVKLATEKNTLEQEKQALTSKVEAFEAKENAQKTALASKLVDDAITAGRITAEKREAFLAMAQADFEQAKVVLEAIPAKQSFAGKTIIPSGTSEEMTEETFMKLSLEEQLAFKADNAEAYQKLFS